MRIIALVQKDLKQLFQQRQTAFFLLIMPIIFTVLFGFMFGGFNGMGGEQDNRLPVGVFDEDQSSFSQAYLDLLALAAFTVVLLGLAVRVLARRMA